MQYDATSDTFSMTEEQAFALAIEGSPAFTPGAFQIAMAQFKAIPKMMAASRTGLGLGWHEHDASLFHGTERVFRPGYAANLVASWISALDGVDARLKAGANVADVGCRHGASTIIMAAQAYPASKFIGFDYPEPSIAHAREAVKKAGLGDRVSFEVASAKTYPGTDYDRVGASAHVRESLRKDGSWMIVEPFANDRLEDNLNPVGRIFHAASTFICTPASRSQEVGRCLGAQAGEARLRHVVTDGGFSKFRRAAQTPFNLIFEARP